MQHLLKNIFGQMLHKRLRKKIIYGNLCFRLPYLPPIIYYKKFSNNRPASVTNTLLLLVTS